MVKDRRKQNKKLSNKILKAKMLLQKDKLKLNMVKRVDTELNEI